MKKKVRKHDKVKLTQNMRIRAENPEKAAKRVESILLRNKMLQQIQAGQYRLTMGRLENAISTTPPGMQREAMIRGREKLERHEALKIA